MSTSMVLMAQTLPVAENEMLRGRSLPAGAHLCGGRDIYQYPPR